MQRKDLLSGASGHPQFIAPLNMCSAFLKTANARYLAASKQMGKNRAFRPSPPSELFELGELGNDGLLKKIATGITRGYSCGGMVSVRWIFRD